MTKPNLPHKLQPHPLTQAIHTLRHPKHGTNNIMRAIPQPPKLLQPPNRRIDLALNTRLQHRLHLDRMRTIHDAKDIIPAHDAEARERRLQVVDGLAHVALGAEDEGGKAVVGELYAFHLADGKEARDELGVGEAGVAQDRAARLQGLDDLVRGVAGEGEARGRGVDFHGAAEGLLRARGHAVGFVEDDELVAAGGKGDFFLGEAFYAVADDVDAWSIKSVFS